MPRKPRKKSETGIYHVIVRGIGQQDIIHEGNLAENSRPEEKVVTKHADRVFVDGT